MLKAYGLEYEDSGDGDAVVMIHGSFIAASFIPLGQQPIIRENYRIVRYHRRGLAGSDAHSGPFSVAEQASDTAALLKYLGLSSAHIVGHSYGGVIALQLALDSPDCVRSLTLIEPATIYTALNPNAQMAAQAIGALANRFQGGDSLGALNAFLTGAEGPNWRDVESLIPGTITQAEGDVATFFKVENPALQEWVFDSELASRITQPTLYILGGASRGQKTTLDLFSLWVPQAEGVTIPDAIHSLHHQQPQLVANAIHQFIARH